MSDVARLGIEVDSSSVAQAAIDLDSLPGAAERAQRGADKLSGGLKRAEQGAGAFAGALRAVLPLVTAITGALSIGVLGQYADAWSDMQSRVGAAIKNMEAAPALMGRIVDIANASYSPLSQTVEIYGRNIAVLRDLGRGATEAADFTEALNHALVTTATKGQDADVVLNALSRAIATGKLRTMEFETIMSRSPRVLEAVADGMGTTVTGLRNLASEGKVTGSVIVDSLIGSLQELRGEAGEMPATIGDAFTRVQTNVLALVGTLDQAWQISASVAEQILYFADGIRGAADVLLRMGNIVGSVVGPALTTMLAGIEAITPAATIAGAAVLGFFAGPALIGGIASATTAIVSGFVPALVAVARGIQGITLAMMANPIGLLIGGLAAGITAAFVFRDQIKTAIGLDVVEVIKSAANSVIGAFKGAYDAIGILWGNFPEVMEALGNMAANKFIAAIEWMLNEASKKLNEWLGFAAKALGMFGPAMLADSMGGAHFGSVSIARRAVNPQGVQSIQAMRDAVVGAQEVDYLSEAGEKLREIWENGEGATKTLAELMAALNGEGDNGGAGFTGGASAQLNAYQEATKAVRDNIAALEQQGLTFGMTETAAFRFNTAMELLSAAQEAGMPITAGVIEEINALADAYAQAEEQARQLEAAAALFDVPDDPFAVLKEQLAGLDTMLARGQISWEQYGMAAFRASSMAASSVLGLASGMTGALAQMFQDNKAFAVANAVVSTAEAVMKALSIYGPTPWGFAAAGVAAATGAAQISAILSAQKGSASAPRVSSGAATAPAAGESQRTTQISVTLQGSGRYSREDLEDLFGQIADGLNNGVDGSERFKVAIAS